MSGVIDENGVQWEHCNSCNIFVEIDNLCYAPSNPDFWEYGLDLCHMCADILAEYGDDAGVDIIRHIQDTYMRGIADQKVKQKVQAKMEAEWADI